MLRKATIGSSWAARRAGTTPKNRPILPETPTATAITSGDPATCNGVITPISKMPPTPKAVPSKPPDVWLAQQGATSHLSPHLTLGTISVRQVYQRTKTRAAQLVHQPKAVFALKAFRDRLRWHDSFTQRVYHHPEIAHQNRYREFDQLYRLDELTPQQQELFSAWQQGQTGFPLVDASMRQLKTMGWMNFRMRAMCATFLTINCGISWQQGARHYMQYLVDGDLAIDNWQWQMQAGVTNVRFVDIVSMFNVRNEH